MITVSSPSCSTWSRWYDIVVEDPQGFLFLTVGLQRIIQGGPTWSLVEAVDQPMFYNGEEEEI
jgi:hypothetical protein